MDVGVAPATGVNVNNPGPLYYDAIAVPTVVFGSAGAGVAVGVAIRQHALRAGIGIVCEASRAVSSSVPAAFAIVAVLTWTMGSEVLIDSTQPARSRSCRSSC